MTSLIPTYANGLCGLPQTLQPSELPFMTSAAACSEPSLVSSNDYPYPRRLLCSLCWCGGASCGLLFLTLELALNPWQYSKASGQFFLPPFEVPHVSSCPYLPGCDEEDFKTSIGFYSIILHTKLPEIRRVCKTWSPLVACIIRTNGYPYMLCGQVWSESLWFVSPPFKFLNGVIG